MSTTGGAAEIQWQAKFTELLFQEEQENSIFICRMWVKIQVDIRRTIQIQLLHKHEDDDDVVYAS